MVLSLYRHILLILSPFLRLWMRVRAFRGREETPHLPQRRGIASLPRPQGPLVWIHAASVGEMRSVLPLVKHLLGKTPDLTCLITTVTVTAARLVRRMANPRILHQYAPLDHEAWVKRFLDYWNPAAVLWVESELWPTMLHEVKARDLPLVMINGRLSARSLRRWKRLPQTIAHILGYFDLCLAQSEEDATRLNTLGAKRIVIAGNMKYSGAPLPYDSAAFDTLHTQIGARPVVLFASTHEGEEIMAARVHQALAQRHAGLLTIVLPRHPARGDAIALQFEKENVAAARRSKNQPVDDTTQIYLADTLGEAGLFYRLAPVVYLGNSLITNPGGGHNPIEPAQLECAIVYGPNMWNFAEVDRELRKARGAVLVRDETALVQTLDELLSDHSRAAELAMAALGFVNTQNGVLDKVARHLQPVLGRAGITT